jgi:hypothetical protein
MLIWSSVHYFILVCTCSLSLIILPLKLNLCLNILVSCICILLCHIAKQTRVSRLTRSHNKVIELATVCLPCQQWTETSVWFDDVGISAFHSCVVVDLWQSPS